VRYRRRIDRNSRSVLGRVFVTMLHDGESALNRREAAPNLADSETTQIAP
jgi:hypothetical protein